CHNHKFDPITQDDYYSLQAVFAAIDRTDRVFDVDPKLTAQRALLEGRRKAAARVPVGPELPETAAEREAVEAELRKLPAARVAYVGAVHHGSGNFAGTGPTGGKPRAIHVLPRGDGTKLGQEVGPGTIATVAGLTGR